MRIVLRSFFVLTFSILLIVAGTSCSTGNRPHSLILPEQRTFQIRTPDELPKSRIPDISEPVTVSTPVPPQESDKPSQQMSLNDALNEAFRNSEVIRVLSGSTATSVAATVYDTAIANTRIDSEHGVFDPQISVQNNFRRSEIPGAILDSDVLPGSRITGSRTDDYDMDLDLSKTTLSGGTARFGVRTNPSRTQPGVFALDPQNRSSLEMSYVQPLLQGAGIKPNMVPIVLARIDTERSYFQFKDAVQQLVQSVINAYWDLVLARTEHWARLQQVKQGQEAFDRESARLKRGFGEVADVAQTRLALANFQASLIAAEGNLLQREAALQSIMGLPPSHRPRLIPTTSPLDTQVKFEWDQLLRMAELHRPDLIELKLILEADQQQRLLAKNQALPQVDAVMLYRWNGLEGETPSGHHISSDSSQFTDWTLGVNFSVPLGLRQARASLRRLDLILARDRANIQQKLLNTVHILSENIRDLDQSYAQYEAFQETRIAARDNLNQQLSEQDRGRVIFLNVLRAITDWGNAVTQEARSLIQYNALLAKLERNTGTILETHGVRFHEERNQSVGPLWIFEDQPNYPTRLKPDMDKERYLKGEGPAENIFNLEDPLNYRNDTRSIPDTDTPDDQSGK